jgi:hypothetical protein
MFYEGRLSGPDADAMREHLASCPRCLEVAMDARAFVEVVGDGRRLVRRRVMIVAAAAGLLIAVGLLALFTPRRDPWADLPVLKADYDLAWRDVEPRPVEPPEFRKAMESYERDDFSKAADLLGKLVASRPAHAASQFYLGVSLLLLGKAGNARAPLASASRLAEGDLLEEARWYLAIACLKAGDPGAAVPELDAVIALGSPRKTDAQKLRERAAAASARR